MRPSPVRIRTGSYGGPRGLPPLGGFSCVNFALESGPRKLPVLPAASGRLEVRSLSKNVQRVAPLS